MSTGGSQSGTTSSSTMRRLRVGLAIQGGVLPAGAFAAGVLKGLVDKGAFTTHDISAFSGTSAGSCVATVCWGNTVNNTINAIKNDAERQWLYFAWPNHLAWVPNWTPEAVTQLIELNAFLMKFPMWRSFVTQVRTPYIRKIMELWIEDIIPIRTLKSRFMSRYGSASLAGRPGLVLGAAEVLRGEIKMFREKDLSLETLLASGSLDEMNGMTRIAAPPHLAGTYLDGAWADNPPINELMDYHLDEIWFIQCFLKEAPMPETPAERQQRKDALWQNSLVEHEREFVDVINKWNDLLNTAITNKIMSLQAIGTLPGTSPFDPTLKSHLRTAFNTLPQDIQRLFDKYNNFDPKKYKKVAVKTIVTNIPREQGSAFVNAPWFIRNMIDHGYERASDFVQRRFGAVPPPPPNSLPSRLALLPAPIPHIIDNRYPKQPLSDSLELICDFCPWKCAATAWDVGFDMACDNVWGQPFRVVFPGMHATGVRARNLIASYCPKTQFKKHAGGLGLPKPWLPMCVPH
jgi:predicted acylesterase/phospholipase RssA